MWQRSVVQPLVAFCRFNCELVLSSVSGDLHHLRKSPNAAKHRSGRLYQGLKQLASYSQQNTNEGDYLEQLQLSVLCWAELTQ